MTCETSLETLNELFGTSGEHYWQLARGIDHRPVVPDREAKSISHETTFAEDIADMDVLRTWLVDLVEQVARRLRHHDLRGRTIDIKVRFADFKTISRSLTLPVPTNVTQELLDAGLELLTSQVPLKEAVPSLFRGQQVAWDCRAPVCQATMQRLVPIKVAVDWHHSISSSW